MCKKHILIAVMFLVGLAILFHLNYINNSLPSYSAKLIPDKIKNGESLRIMAEGDASFVEAVIREAETNNFVDSIILREVETPSVYYGEWVAHSLHSPRFYIAEINFYKKNINGMSYIAHRINLNFQDPTQILMMYDAVAPIPIGWSENTTYRNHLIRGYDKAGVILGNYSHIHNFSQVSINVSAISEGVNIVPVTPTIPASHTHSLGSNGVTNAETNLPMSKTVIVINQTYSSGISVPTDTILMFNSTDDITGDWSLFTDFDNYYIVGSDVSAQDLGGATHNHVIGANVGNTDPDTQSAVLIAEGMDVEVTMDDHTHSFPASNTNTPSANNYAPFISVILGKATNPTTIPERAYAMFDSTPPSNWKVVSNAGGLFHNRTILANNTFGITGGDSISINGDHNHTEVTLITSNAEPTIFAESNVAGASDNVHDHEVVVAIHNETVLPPMATVIIAQKNSKPVVTEPAINNTDPDLDTTANTTVSDGDMEVLSVFFNWSIDGTHLVQFNFTGILNGTLVNSTIGNGNYTSGQNVSVVVWAGDGYENSTSDEMSVIMAAGDVILPHGTYTEPPTPINNFNSTNTTWSFEITYVDETDLTGSVCYFELNWVNITGTISILDAKTYTCNITYGVADNSRNNYTFWFNDTANNFNLTPRRNLTIDNTPPIVTLVDPTPANNTPTRNNNITFNATAVDSLLYIDYCLLEFDGTNESMTEVGTGLSIYCEKYKENVSIGVYNFKVWACDIVGNCGESDTWILDLVGGATATEWYYFAISTGLGGVLGFLLIGAVFMKRKFLPFKLLYAIMLLILVLPTLEIMRLFAVNNSETDLATIIGGIYGGMMWIVVLIISLILIWIFYRLATNMKGVKNEIFGDIGDMNG